MKKKKFLFGALAIAVSVAGLVSCQKTLKETKAPNEGQSASLFAKRSVTCECESITDSTISGVITTDLTLSHCKEYQLDGLVYVSNNSTLTIEPGTRIVGLAGAPGVPGGGLVVTRGSYLIADGTPECPIVFTSYRWDGVGENAPKSGDWAGIIILGKAPVNVSPDPLIEGVPDNPPADANYGGSDCEDSSGVLRYVRIEYPGFELLADKEINGLTLGGVGCRTVIDYVQVYKSRDDAFEFFGGTVNATHLIAVDALDDMFDFDQGYVGHIQFALGMSDTTRADISQSNGIETDNNPNGLGTPATRAEISNLTLIGLPDRATAVLTNRPPSGTLAASYGRAAHIRRNSGIVLHNSLFMGWKWGISLDGQLSQDKMLSSGISCFQSNLVHAYDTAFKYEGFYPGGGPSPWSVAGNTGYLTANPNQDILLVDPFVRETFNFATPGSGSPALSATFNSSCFAGGCCSFLFSSNSYRGAFDIDDNWAQDLLYGGWVRYRAD